MKPQYLGNPFQVMMIKMMALGILDGNDADNENGDHHHHLDQASF